MYPNTLNTHLSTGYPSLSKYMQPRDDHFKILESVKQAMPDQGSVYQSDRTSIDDACAVLERGRSHAALKDFGDWSDGSVVKDMDRSCQGRKLDSQHPCQAVHNCL